MTATNLYVVTGGGGFVGGGGALISSSVGNDAAGAGSNYIPTNNVNTFVIYNGALNTSDPFYTAGAGAGGSSSSGGNGYVGNRAPAH